MGVSAARPREAGAQGGGGLVRTFVSLPQTIAWDRQTCVVLVPAWASDFPTSSTLWRTLLGANCGSTLRVGRIPALGSGHMTVQPCRHRFGIISRTR